MKALSMGPTFKIQEPECPPHPHPPTKKKKKKKREREKKRKVVHLKSKT